MNQNGPLATLLHEFELPISNPVLFFSVILFIILLSPLVLRKLKIPGVIGLIISGVVIGPHGFNILESNEAIELFSTIGLLYIMFIAGLELDMNDFKIFRNKSLAFGFFTFMIPMLVGYPVCYYLLNYSSNASLLTASMFATHTLVAYPIVSKYGISKNQAVAVTIGGTILTDTAVLILLAIILGRASGQIDQGFWIQLGLSITTFTAIVFLIIPKVAKWFFNKLESEKHSHYIFVLAVVFFTAFLAEIAGLEPIIGAFLAGLALNKLIPHSSALMNRIDFIGNALFIPFFLISVGMLVNVKVIFSGTGALIVAAILTVTALITKWLAAYFTQVFFNFTKAQRAIMYGLSSARVAASLAVILVGYRSDIINEDILNGTIILILLTSIISSFATEKAAKKLVKETELDRQMLEKTTNTADEVILLPIANLQSMERLLEFCIYIKHPQAEKSIHILSVVSNNDEAEINLLKARKKLEELAKEASATETNVKILATIDHNPASGIIRMSKEIAADIVILGWPQKPGILEIIIGDKVNSLINHSDKTTFICALQSPIANHKRIFLAVPPLAEREKGFIQWLAKVTQMARELSSGIYLYSNPETQKAIHTFLDQQKLNTQLHFIHYTDWNHLSTIALDLENDDLVFLVSARKNAISHLRELENLPSKMESEFKAVSKIIIYPQQFTDPSGVAELMDYL